MDHHIEQRQTRSGRVVRNTACYSEGLTQWEQGIVAWEVLISQDETEDLLMAQTQYEIQKGMQEPVAYMASANPDIMYLHEAMKVPDRDQFKRAMDKELQDHIARRHWEVVPRGEVPKGMRVLDMVWAMRRKRHRNAKSTNGRHGLMSTVASSNEALIIGKHMLQSSCGKPFASSLCWQSSEGGKANK